MSAYGYVVLGCKIDDVRLSQAIKKFSDNSKQVKKGCSHDVPEQNKFCPECGAPKTIVTKDEELGDREFLEGIKGLVIETTTDEQDFFVTIDNKYVGRTGDIDAGGGYKGFNFPSALEINDLAYKLEQKLLPYGLWDGKNFKIWLLGCYL